MRRLGSILMIAGLLVGVLLSLAMVFGVRVPGLPWVLSVGLVKIIMLGGIGLIGTGATLQRIARRNAERERFREPT